MGTGKKWTRNQKLLLATVIVSIVAASLHFFGKQGVRVDGDVGAIGDHANVTIDKRTGVDANVYGAEVEKRVIAETQVKKYKEEMREIEATKYEELSKRYALGYILFYVDHKYVAIPNESRLGTECAIDLSNAKVTFNDTAIDVELPDFKCLHGPTISGCRWGVSRTFGQQTPVKGNWVNRDTQMYFEMLVDHGDSLVCVLGFAKDTK